MRIALVAHTASLRQVAVEAAGRLRRDDRTWEVVVVDLSSSAPPGAAVVDAEGVLRLPVDPTVPVVASTALAQAARLAEWLGQFKPDISMLPADAGLAYYAVAQREQGLVPRSSRIGCVMLHAPDLDAARQSTWLANPALLERAVTTGAAVTHADLLVLTPGASTVVLQQRGWLVPGDTRRVDVIDATVLVNAVRDLATCARPAESDPLPEEEMPRITVCVTHHDRPELLRQALSTVAAQTYPHVEVIVVDDGSRQPETLAVLDAMAPWMAARGWRLLREPNRFPGAARNTAARYATGTHLLFLDDDDGLTPDALETFARAARGTGADVVTAFADYFEGSRPPNAPGPLHHRWVAPGPCGAQSLLQNDFGVVTALIRRDAFESAGGFREQQGVGFEDWEFFLALYTAGRRFTVVPRPLVRVRWSTSGRMAESESRRVTSHMDALRPVDAAMPEAWRDLPALAVGLHVQNRLLAQRITALEKELERAKRTMAVQATGPVHSLPSPIARGSTPPVRCHVWHTEGLGLSGILSWMWRLRTQIGPQTDVDVRLVDLAVQPYGFQQVGPDPSMLYDERVETSAAFSAFLQHTAGDVHIINHAFTYVAAMVEQLGHEVVSALRLVGVCHTDQDYYYDNLTRLAPVLRAIVCVSDTCARELAARIPEHRAKLVVLPAWAVSLPANPVPPYEKGKPLRLLYTGRIVQYQKRVLDLAILAVELRRAGVNATITIVGDGPDLPLLQEALAKVAPYGVPVTVEPVRAPWDMEPMLRAHDAFVQVSEFEGASVSLMEALAYGLLPVVTTTRSGHDLLVPGSNTVTAPVGDMQALAAALAEVVRQKGQGAALQRGARETAERYLEELAYPERLAGLISRIARGVNVS